MRISYIFVNISKTVHIEFSYKMHRFVIKKLKLIFFQFFSNFSKKKLKFKIDFNRANNLGLIVEKWRRVPKGPYKPDLSFWGPN